MQRTLSHLKDINRNLRTEIRSITFLFFFFTSFMGILQLQQFRLI